MPAITIQNQCLGCGGIPIEKLTRKEYNEEKLVRIRKEITQLQESNWREALKVLKMYFHAGVITDREYQRFVKALF